MPVLTVGTAAGCPVIGIFIDHSEAYRLAAQRRALLVSEPQEVLGLIDTGAECTIVDATVIRSLGLVPIGTTQVFSPSSGQSAHASVCRQFHAGIFLRDPAVAPPSSPLWMMAPTLPVIEMDLSEQGIGAIIGCDVLAQCVFTFDGPHRQITLAF